MTNQSNPFDDLERLFEQMQERFGETARRWERESGLPETTSMSVDLEDRDDELVLSADLPGFETEDIDVRVTDRTLRIEAEHEETEETEETEEGEFLRRERRRASASRSIRLPAAVEQDDITANYNNGVLTVRLPKSDAATEGTTIDIE